MRINTQRSGVVHSHPAIRAWSLLNKPVTSFHMKLSFGELLTTTSWKIWHALHLSLLFTCPCEHPPKPRQQPWIHPCIMVTPYTETCLGKTCSVLVWRKKNHNLLPLIRFTSQSYSKMPNCTTTEKSTGTFKKDYQIVVFYYRKQFQFKDNKI